MRVSVVIPAHNRPEFLLEAVKSISTQTHLDREVVIVDDGSSPPIPVAPLKDILGDSFIIIRHDAPRGVACAKNVGVHAATGEIITLLDDDDVLAPTALEEIADAFTSHPELDCLFLGVQPFGSYATDPAENRKKAIDKLLQRLCPRESEELYFFDSNLFSELLHSVPIDFQRPAARRGAWNIVGGFDESSLFSESIWTIKASTMCNIALTKEPVTFWRIHGNNFGWPSELDHDQAILRQIGNGLASAQALVRDFRHKRANITSHVKGAEAHLAEIYFNKAYFLLDKNKSEGLPALIRSMLLTPRLKHVKLLVRYFWA